MKIIKGKMIKRILLLMIIVFFYSCYRTFINKEKIVGDLYLVEHEMAEGKSLVILNENVPVSTLIAGSIMELRANDSILILIQRQNDLSNKYFTFSIKKTRYKEDILEINGFKYDSIVQNLEFNYIFITPPSSESVTASDE